MTVTPFTADLLQLAYLALGDLAIIIGGLWLLAAFAVALVLTTAIIARSWHP